MSRWWSQARFDHSPAPLNAEPWVVDALRDPSMPSHLDRIGSARRSQGMQATLERAQEALNLAGQIATREGLAGQDRERFIRVLAQRIGIPPLPGLSLVTYFIGMAIGIAAALAIIAAFNEKVLTKAALLTALFVGIISGPGAVALQSRRALKRFHAPLPPLDVFWPTYVRDHRPGLRSEFPLPDLAPGHATQKPRGGNS